MKALKSVLLVAVLRKILNNEKFDDIDLAINVEPKIVKSILEKNNINFYETGIEHGTITALINNKKFEITSLRKDVSPMEDMLWWNFRTIGK